MSHYPLHRNKSGAIRLIGGTILAAASPMLFVFAFGELVKNDVWAFLFTAAAGLLWLLGGLWSVGSAMTERGRGERGKKERGERRRRWPSFVDG